MKRFRLGRPLRQEPMAIVHEADASDVVAFDERMADQTRWRAKASSPDSWTHGGRACARATLDAPRRRDHEDPGAVSMLVLSLLAGPLAAEAQQGGRVWRIGVLYLSARPYHEAFRDELRELGYVEGRNPVLEYR